VHPPFPVARPSDEHVSPVGSSLKTTENPGYASTGPSGDGLVNGGPNALTAQSDTYLRSDRGGRWGWGRAGPRSRSMRRGCPGQAARRVSRDLSTGVTQAMAMAMVTQRGRPTCGATDL
jgi:hypothetical protein